MKKINQRAIDKQLGFLDFSTFETLLFLFHIHENFYLNI